MEEDGFAPRIALSVIKLVCTIGKMAKYQQPSSFMLSAKLTDFLASSESSWDEEERNNKSELWSRQSKEEKRSFSDQLSSL